MKGWPQAVTVTVFAAFAVLLVPFLAPAAWVSGAAVGLVTLRLGLGQGLRVVLVSTGLIAVLMMLVTGEVGTWAGALTWSVIWVAVLIAAWVLREQVSLPWAIQALVLVVSVGVALFYVAVGDPEVWWRAQFDLLFAAVGNMGEGLAGSAGSNPYSEIHDLLNAYAAGFTGAVATSALVSFVLSLLLARSWQSALYNPGGYREEFHQLRFSMNWAVLTAITVIAAWLTDSQLALDIAGLVLLVYALEGLAVIHFAVRDKEKPGLILAAVYVPVILFFALAVKLLTLLGMVDSWLDIRSRISKDGSGPGQS